jgi:opacity protein-like surface antigen
MKRTIFAAAVIIAGAAAVAPAPVAQTRTGTAKQGEQQITVSGCVQREADYRRAQDKGRGGVAGTGVGVENEYVLTNLSITGESGKSVDATTAYELTGANEKLAGPHVGHRVEISGTLKAAEVTATGATGGATAGTPPRGVDVASKDLRLRELEVATVKMISADCAAK